MKTARHTKATGQSPSGLNPVARDRADAQRHQSRPPQRQRRRALLQPGHLGAHDPVIMSIVAPLHVSPALLPPVSMPAASTPPTTSTTKAMLMIVR